jgi:type 1 glutamine amidotransferase
MILLLASMVLLCSCGGSTQSGKTDVNTKVVVVTAGHGFEREAFFAVFDALEGVDYVEAEQKDESELFEDISSWDYDVIVFYNMTQKISPKRQENFKKLLSDGVGVVAMHHSIAAYSKWPEFKRIIGAKFYLEAMEEEGVSHEKSTYKHDLDVAIHVEDKGHPITRGMSDFVIHDETYKKCSFEKGNRVLLTTDNPHGDKPICWTRKYSNARVCYLQLGHDKHSYANENYQKLIHRTIQWSAGKLKYTLKGSKSPRIKP